MNTAELQKLVKTSGYQVFLLACPASIPCNFALHPWFVCVRNGEISRYEIRFEMSRDNPDIFKHFHLNQLPPFSGIEKFTFIPKEYLWKNVRLLGMVEGDENSLAKKVLDFIEQSSEKYPYCNKYKIWGPNSNTYAQWVLNNFPDFKVDLPWNCFGKNYGIKIL